MVLKAENLTFAYPGTGRNLFEHMDFCADTGERVGLAAGSGFGKTTLCRLLAGYERPQTGQVFLDNRPLTSYQGKCPVQLIWQHPELSVNPRWRMRQALREGGVEPGRITEGLGIKDQWLDRFPEELSGGELQRCCIARALGEGTRFLLADELSAMFDLVTQKEIWDFLLQEAREREIGILAVSHSKKLLETICTRIVYLEDREERRGQTWM